MFTRRDVLLAISTLLAARPSFGTASPLLVGSYDAERMRSIKPLTLPRIMVYDRNGTLVERAAWPAELAGLKATAGDAFCCVSDAPSVPGSQEPPTDCKPLVYGKDVREHFNGLRSASGKSLSYETLPVHKHLVVDYYASWCSPCLPARRELETFLSSGFRRLCWLAHRLQQPCVGLSAP